MYIACRYLKKEISLLAKETICRFDINHQLIIYIYLDLKIPLKDIFFLKKEDIHKEPVNSFMKCISTYFDEHICDEIKQREENLTAGEFYFDSHLTRSSVAIILLNKISCFNRLFKKNFGERLDQNKQYESTPPDALVIGYPKCASTWFYEICKKLDLVDVSKKEICYFSENYINGDEWYMSHFDGQYKCRIDVSQNYILSDLYLSRIRNFERTHNHCFKKIIFIRRPSEFIPSLLYQFRKGGRGWFNFESYIHSGSFKSIFWDLANFKKSIGKTEKYFDKNSIKIVFHEEIKKNPRQVILDIISFIVGDSDLSEIYEADDSLFKSKYNPRQSTRSHALLKVLLDIKLRVTLLPLGSTVHHFIAKGFVLAQRVMMKKFISEDNFLDEIKKCLTMRVLEEEYDSYAKENIGK